MRWVGAGLVLGVALTSFAADPQEQAPMSSPPARLEWSLDRSSDGGALEIRYTVTSTADRTVYLCDALPVPGQTSFVLGRDFINVSGGGDGDVRFVRGRLPSVAPVVLPLQPGCRPLAPGQVITGSATARLPLQPTHFHGKAPPFLGTPARAWLEIGWVEADAHWAELTLEDGRKLTTPSAEDEVQNLRAGPIELPK